jgi:hypothetical protein
LLGEIAIFADYPRLTVDDVKGCLAYAEALVEEETGYPLEKKQPEHPHTTVGSSYWMRMLNIALPLS